MASKLSAKEAECVSTLKTFVCLAGWGLNCSRQEEQKPPNQPSPRTFLQMKVRHRQCVSVSKMAHQVPPRGGAWETRTFLEPPVCWIQPASLPRSLVNAVCRDQHFRPQSNTPKQGRGGAGRWTDSGEGPPAFLRGEASVRPHINTWICSWTPFLPTLCQPKDWTFSYR